MEDARAGPSPPVSGRERPVVLLLLLVGSGGSGGGSCLLPPPASPVLVPVCAPYPLCGVLLLLEHERVDGLSPTTSLTAASPTNRPPSPPATPAAPKWVATGEVVPEERATAWLTREAAAAKIVKVAVDGAPDLRKVNLQDYAGYDQLIRAPEQGGSRTRR